jgi:hypothetical protein
MFLLAVSTSFGHGGGIDSNGGHYNRKTGEYHYHGNNDTSNWGWVVLVIGGVIVFGVLTSKRNR